LTRFFLAEPECAAVLRPAARRATLWHDNFRRPEPSLGVSPTQVTQHSNLFPGCLPPLSSSYSLPALQQAAAALRTSMPVFIAPGHNLGPAPQLNSTNFQANAFSHALGASLYSLARPIPQFVCCPVSGDSGNSVALLPSMLLPLRHPLLQSLRGPTTSLMSSDVAPVAVVGRTPRADHQAPMHEPTAPIFQLFQDQLSRQNP
jgi:hypothetical protein